MTDVQNTDREKAQAIIRAIENFLSSFEKIDDYILSNFADLGAKGQIREAMVFIDETGILDQCNQIFESIESSFLCLYKHQPGEATATKQAIDKITNYVVIIGGDIQNIRQTIDKITIDKTNEQIKKEIHDILESRKQKRQGGFNFVFAEPKIYLHSGQPDFKFLMHSLLHHKRREYRIKQAALLYQSIDDLGLRVLAGIDKTPSNQRFISLANGKTKTEAVSIEQSKTPLSVKISEKAKTRFERLLFEAENFINEYNDIESFIRRNSEYIDPSGFIHKIYDMLIDDKLCMLGCALKEALESSQLYLYQYLSEPLDIIKEKIETVIKIIYNTSEDFVNISCCANMIIHIFENKTRKERSREEIEEIIFEAIRHTWNPTTNTIDPLEKPGNEVPDAHKLLGCYFNHQRIDYRLEQMTLLSQIVNSFNLRELAGMEPQAANQNPAPGGQQKRDNIISIDLKTLSKTPSKTLLEDLVLNPDGVLYNESRHGVRQPRQLRETLRKKGNNTIADAIDELENGMIRLKPGIAFCGKNIETEKNKSSGNSTQ